MPINQDLFMLEVTSEFQRFMDYLWDEEVVEDFPDPQLRWKWVQGEDRQFWVSKYGISSVRSLRDFRPQDSYLLNPDTLRGLKVGVLHCPGDRWADFPLDRFPVSILKMQGIYRLDFHTDQLISSYTIP